MTRDELICNLERENIVEGFVATSDNILGHITVYGEINGILCNGEYVFNVTDHNNGITYDFDFSDLMEAEVVG